MDGFKIDEGHVFSLEDTISYIKWKINELLQDGFSYEDILDWDNSEIWTYYVELLIEYEKRRI